MEITKEILSSITWPHITLILGIVFLVLYKVPLSGFIKRVRSVGRNGLTTDIELTPQKQTNDTYDIIQYIEVEKSALLSELEDKIYEDLKSKNLDHESDAVKVLVRNLAVTQINLDHGQTYNSIFGSQIYLLKTLNESLGRGQPEEFLNEFYSSVKGKYEDAFSNWTLDEYLNFLKVRALISFENSNWHISTKGQDFLIWLARNGMSENKGY